VSEETRKNLTALAIVFVPVLVLAAFAFRPTPILGLSEAELSEDLTRYYKTRDGPSDVSTIECSEAAEDEYKCSLGPSTDAGSITVMTDWAGCWAVEDSSVDSGCITLLDVLGDRPTVTSNY
jgi:hypothetical protein